MNNSNANDTLKLQINHDEQAAVVFTSHQTESMFILTSSHLKGYGRKDIKIEINEDGSKMTIIGDQKHQQGTNRMSKGFHKTFTIPNGVFLDKVKAKFDQDQSRLIIRMPKHSARSISSDQPHHHHIDENAPDHDKIRQPESQEVVGDDHSKEAKKPTEGKGSLPPVNTPLIIGSTLFVSLIVVLFGFIRSRNESTKKTN